MALCQHLIIVCITFVDEEKTPAAAAADTSRTTNTDQYRPMAIIEKRRRKERNEKKTRILVRLLSRGTYAYTYIHAHTIYVVCCLAQLSNNSPSHIELSSPLLLCLFTIKYVLQ